MLFKVTDTIYYNPERISFENGKLHFTASVGDAIKYYDADLTPALFEAACNDAARQGLGVLDVTPEGVARIKKKFEKPSGPVTSLVP